MTSDNTQDRFHKTMIEIANQVEINSDISNFESMARTIELILEINNNNKLVFVYGAGRSGFIGRCFAQRLMHLGIKSCFISDAVTYQYTSKDLLIIISGSGETISSVAMTKKAKEIGGKIISLTNNPSSTIGTLSDFVIEIKGKSKDIALTQKTLAPYTSLFDISTLAILDSIGGVLMEKLNVTEQDIDKRHASIE
ncbi:MAG: SIS domain-containing protein [Candidatus Thorarchaeota archaeon]